MTGILKRLDTCAGRWQEDFEKLAGVHRIHDVDTPESTDSDYLTARRALIDATSSAAGNSDVGTCLAAISEAVFQIGEKISLITVDSSHQHTAVIFHYYSGQQHDLSH